MGKKPKIIIKINLEYLLDWYYSTSDEIMRLGEEVKEMMLEEENDHKVDISWESAWESMGYIPAHILHQDTLDEYPEIDDTCDLEEWKRYDDIHDYHFINRKGERIK